ncbi:hypothetical protein BSKO_11728 [Bryopsis sp. KO-2023]|nr:hypothetical protein BSKO_11728 [Bryopsis sp. KO-2023]
MIFLEPVNIGIERARKFWVDLVYLVLEAVRRRIAAYHVDASQKLANLPKAKGDNPPLCGTKLSFFDDFRIISGVPVLTLDPDRYGTQSREPSINSTNPWDGAAGGIQKITFYENKNAITCCNFSADGSRIASGHNDGSAMIWSTQHGTLLYECQKLHKLSPIADIRFSEDSNDIVMSCDFHGQFTIWHVEDSKFQYGHCAENWQDVSMFAPKVRWPMFSEDATGLIFPVTYFREKKDESGQVERMGELFSSGGGTPRKRTSKSDGYVFVPECALIILDTKQAGASREVEMKPMRVLTVAPHQDVSDFEFAWSGFAHQSGGMLAGFNARPFGFMVVWPDMHGPNLGGYQLDGTIGCWSPEDDYVASWNISIKGSSDEKAGACYVWCMETIKNEENNLPFNHEFIDHTRRCPLVKPTALRDPQGGNVFWADFIPDLHGNLGIATCIIKTHLDIVLWEVETKTILHRLRTGIHRDDTRLTDIQAWDDSWVHVQRSYGLRLITLSGDGRWLGIYSSDASRGSVWDVRSGIEVLSFSVPDELASNEQGDLLGVDMFFSEKGDRFVICSEEKMTVWQTHALGAGCQTAGVSRVALQSADSLLSTGQVQCQFSLDGNMLGVCRAYSLMMSTWDLTDGRMRTLIFPEDDSAGNPVTVRKIRSMLSYERNDLESFRSMDVFETSGGNPSRFCLFAFSMDGKRVATCMADVSVLVWTLADGDKVIDTPTKIGSLRSKYFPAWAMCFSVDPKGKETIVVCEDSGVLVWLEVEARKVVKRRNGSGLRRARFSLDGMTGVLMPSNQVAHVWDLVNRQRIRTVTFNLWMGPAGPIPFPHNLSTDGNFAFAGINKGVNHLNPGGRFITCTKDTTELDLLNLHKVPRNVVMTDNPEWVVVDEFIELNPKVGVPGVATSKYPLPYIMEGDEGKLGGSIQSIASPGPVRKPDKLDIAAARNLLSSDSAAPLIGQDSIGSVLSIPEKEAEITPLSPGNPGKSPRPQPAMQTQRITSRISSTSQRFRPGASRDASVRTRYPMAVDFQAKESWSYLLNRELTAHSPIDSLTMLHVGGVHSPKVLHGKGLLPHKFIATSYDGRRVACLSNNNSVFVWTAFATEGSMPAWNDLEVLGESADQAKMKELLEIHGPGLLNFPDHDKMTIPLHVVTKRDHVMLETLVSFAVARELPVNLICDAPPSHQEGASTDTITALGLALRSRAPESVEILLQYLHQGLTTPVATADIYKVSILRLARIFPTVFHKVLSDDSLMYTFPEIRVPENTFRTNPFKVMTSDTMVPSRDMLKQMWKETLKVNQQYKRRITRSPNDGTKMIPAQASVVLYPGIADFGMKGLLKQIAIGRAAANHNQIYSSLAIRAIIHQKWVSFGRRLLIEEIWSFSFMWLCFTGYALVLGSVWHLATIYDFVADDDFGVEGITAGDERKNLAAVALLVMAWVISALNLIRQVNLLIDLWFESKLSGLVLWMRSFWNWMDLITHVILVCCIGPLHLMIASSKTQALESEEQNGQKRLTVLVCAESIFLSWKMLHFAQAFRWTAPMVLMINEIVKAIFVFLVITFGLVFGFAISFNVLFRIEIHKPRDPNVEPEESLLEVEDLFGNIGVSLVTAFGMMLGETQLDKLSTLEPMMRVVGTLMFVVYLMAIMVILLNLLIAVMGDSFDRVKNLELRQFQKGRAQVLIDLESMMSEHRRKELCAQIGQYLHILSPKQADSSREWKGRLVEQNELFKKEMGNLLNEMKGEVRGNCRTLLEVLEINNLIVPQLQEHPTNVGASGSGWTKTDPMETGGGHSSKSLPVV